MKLSGVELPESEIELVELLIKCISIFHRSLHLVQVSRGLLYGFSVDYTREDAKNQMEAILKHASEYYRVLSKTTHAVKQRKFDQLQEMLAKVKELDKIMGFNSLATIEMQIHSEIASAELFEGW